MRWTRRRSQTSGADPPSPKLRRDRYQDRRVAFVETVRGRRSRVVLAPRRWRQVLKKLTLLRSDGGKKARSPGRARRKPLKPLRGECRAFRCDRGDLLVCFLFLHTRLRARRAPGIPCTLC